MVGRIARWSARRRLARLSRWRAGLAAGDRCWVLAPGRRAPTRLTIRERTGDTVALLLYVDPADGERCLLGIPLARLFPDEPRAWEIELLEGEGATARR